MCKNHIKPFDAFCCASAWKNQTWNQRWCYSFCTSGFQHHSIQTALEVGPKMQAWVRAEAQARAQVGRWLAASRRTVLRAVPPVSAKKTNASESQQHSNQSTLPGTTRTDGNIFGLSNTNLKRGKFLTFAECQPWRRISTHILKSSRQCLSTESIFWLTGDQFRVLTILKILSKFGMFPV